MECKRCGSDFIQTERQVRRKERVCRECVNLGARQRRKALRDAIAAGDRDAIARHEASKASRRRWRASPQGKASALKSYRRATTIAGNREQSTARMRVQRAIEQGQIVRPDHCEMCDRGPVQAHHVDYSRPLDVMWLCQTHHKEQHEVELAEKAW